MFFVFISRSVFFFLCMCAHNAHLFKIVYSPNDFDALENPLLSHSIIAIYRAFYVWSFNSTCQTNIKSHYCSGNAAIDTANVDINACFLYPIDSHCTIIFVASKHRPTFLHDDSCKTSNRFENLHISYQFCCYSHFSHFTSVRLFRANIFFCHLSFRKTLAKRTEIRRMIENSK